MALMNLNHYRSKLGLYRKSDRTMVVCSIVFSLTVFGLFCSFNIPVALAHQDEKLSNVQIIKTSKLVAPIAIFLEGPQVLEPLQPTMAHLVVETKLAGELAIEIKGSIVEDQKIRQDFSLAQPKKHRLAIPFRLNPALGNPGINKVYSLVTITGKDGWQQSRRQAFAIEIAPVTRELEERALPDA